MTEQIETLRKDGWEINADATMARYPEGEWIDIDLAIAVWEDTHDVE